MIGLNFVVDSSFPGTLILAGIFRPPSAHSRIIHLPAQDFVSTLVPADTGTRSSAPQVLSGTSPPAIPQAVPSPSHAHSRKSSILPRPFVCLFSASFPPRGRRFLPSPVDPAASLHSPFLLPRLHPRRPPSLFPLPPPSPPPFQLGRSGPRHSLSQPHRYFRFWTTTRISLALSSPLLSQSTTLPGPPTRPQYMFIFRPRSPH